jgi:molecular chaperone Hsp33
MAVDELHKFLFEGLPVRGMLVRLTDAWPRCCARAPRSDRRLPGAGARAAGRDGAAAVLMQSNIKFDGALILQVFGDGPVKLAVAEVQPDLACAPRPRWWARWRAGRAAGGDAQRARQGRCAITLDPKDRLPGQQPYQGVVPLHGDRRAAAAAGRGAGALHAAVRAARHAAGAGRRRQVAAGLLIQRLPVEGEGNLAAQRQHRNEDEIGLQRDFNRIATWPPR